MSPFCFRIAILKEHYDHFFQVLVQLIQGLALGMGTSETGYVSHIEPGILLQRSTIAVHSIFSLFAILA